jgi:hypothetical protein
MGQLFRPTWTCNFRNLGANAQNFLSQLGIPDRLATAIVRHPSFALIYGRMPSGLKSPERNVRSGMTFDIIGAAAPAPMMQQDQNSKT